MSDAVSPSHYQQGEIETIDAIKAALGKEGLRLTALVTASNTSGATSSRTAWKTCTRRMSTSVG